MVAKCSVTFRGLESFCASGRVVQTLANEANVLILVVSRHSGVLLGRIMDLIPVFEEIRSDTTLLVAEAAIPL